MRNKCVLLFGILLSFAASAPAELIFNMGSSWRYRKGTNEVSSPMTAWRANGFNDSDSSWGTANATFYYGESLSGTLLNDMNGGYTCIFMRKTFNIANPAAVTAMELRTIMDDGAIAWINGVEVMRMNMPAGEIPFNGAASAALDPELVVRVHPLPPPSSYLVAGQNTITIQAFNSSLSGSSDFVIDAQLLAAVPDTAPPTIVGINPPPGAVTNLDQITVTFSEPVADVELLDFQINGQAPLLMTVISDSTYTFTFAQPPFGTVQVSWAGNHEIQDYALPPNGFDHTAASASWQYNLVDTVPPFIVRLIPGSGSTVRELAEIEVEFDGPVVNGNAGDLLINGAPATDFTAGSPSQLVFRFTQPPTGAVSVAFASGHGITDTAGNPFGGASWSYTLDTNLPPDLFIISELQAADNATYRDEDGDYSDWIEIHNRAEVAGSLNGWFLTDDANDLTRWRFPNVAVGPGGYLVVFASNKNRTNTTGRLHTNFQLSRGGEYLALVDPNTNVVSAFAPTYQGWPAGSTANISYGRDRSDPNQKGFFTITTPGQPNQSGGPGSFAPDVVFSREEGTFVSPFTVSLSLATPNPNAEIRYVIVNSSAQASLTNVPVATSALYTGPITVNGTMQIRARAFAPGLLPGSPLTHSYIQIASNAMNFTSDLPLVIVHNFGAGSFPVSGSDQTAIVAFFDVDEVTGRSSLTNRPQIINRAGVNRRGSSTEGYPKASLAVELWDEFNDDVDREVLGLPEESDWILYAPNQFDQSRLHNPLGLSLARDTGKYAPRTKMVEVFLDVSGGSVNLPAFTSAGDYSGIHVLEEKIKRNRNRLDIPRIEVENTTAPSVTGGWLLKIDRLDTVGNGIERQFSAAGATIVYQEPDGLLVQDLPQWDPQEQYIINYFNQFGNALNGVNYTNPITGYAAFIDVQSWIEFHLVNTMTMNVDAFRLSGYFFKDRNKKIEMGPAWDFDRAMGTSGRAESANDWRAFNPRAWRANNVLGGTDYGTDFFNNSTPPPWWGRLFNDIDFFQRYIDTYQQLRTTIWDTNAILARIDAMAAEIAEAVPRDQTRWSGQGDSSITPRSGSLSAPVPGFTPSTFTYSFPGTFQGEVDFLKHWMWAHINFMDTNFLGRPTLSQPGGMLTAPIELAMIPPTNLVGTTIYYTLNGTDPRLPGGGIAPGALIYSGPISITSNTRVFARCRNLNHHNMTGPANPPRDTPWSGAMEATYYFNVPNVRITEIMYHPADAPAGNTNDADNFEYVEVKNIGGAAINLNGFRLRGGVDFDFGNLVLNAGQSAVVVAHSNAFVGRYGTGRLIAGVFNDDRLNNGGERLKLEGSLREPIHDFEYSDDWYPTTDGHGFSLVIRDEAAALDTWGFAASWRPSGALNGSPAQDDPPQPNLAQVVINEVLTHSDPAPPFDTIELLNLGSSAANIGGWFLTDDFRNPKKYRILDGTTISGNGFITFDENQFNIGATAFSLSSLGEEVYLFSGDGTNLTGYVHGFDFGAAANSVTFGRHINSVGSEQFPPQRLSSLGAANAGPLVGPIVVSEIMYHPIDHLHRGLPLDNSLDEYIELYNNSDDPAPLHDPLRGTNTWRLRDAVDFEFPPNISIPARGVVLVVSFDPMDVNRLNTFRERNGVSASVPIFGPFRGKLDNSSEAVELERPDNPEPAGPPNFGLVPYLLVERVRYSDDVPWPPAADGIGPSLQRSNASGYGNDPANWVAAVPTPGVPFAGGSAPVITQQPTNQTKIATHSTTMSVVASGALTYQWRFNGNLIRGETNSTLDFPSVRVDQEGFYDVLVINAAGSVLSDTVFLDVLIPANIFAHPQNILFTTGSTNPATYGQTTNTAIFSVSASSSTPITYQWRYNGGIIPGATGTSLAISNANLTHNGIYDCLVTDGVGTIMTLPARLTVGVRAFVTRHPQPITALVGEDVTFSADYGGSEPMGHRWRGRGQTVVNFPGVRVYTINSVQTTHSGNYDVIVTNIAVGLPGLGSLQATLTVLADTDGDKAPDTWETQFGFLPNDGGDGGMDFDGDGMSNADEFRAGTNPTNALSYLRVDLSFGNTNLITFFAVSNKTYVVEYNNSLDAGQWVELETVTFQRTNRTITIRDPALAESPRRYYRLATPMPQD